MLDLYGLKSMKFLNSLPLYKGKSIVCIAFVFAVLATSNAACAKIFAAFAFVYAESKVVFTDANDDFIAQSPRENDIMQELPDEPGEITMHLHKLPSMLYSYIEDMRDMIIPQFIVYVAAIVYFSYYDIRIGIALFSIILLLLISVNYTLDNCAHISQKRDNQYNTMMEEITDVMKNITSVLNANTELRETERTSKFQEEYYELSRKSLRCAYKVRYILIPVVLGFFTWSLTRMYKFVKKGTIESHKMVSLVLILLYLMKSMWVVIYNLKDQVFRWGSIQASFVLFNECAPNEKQVTNYENNLPAGFILKGITYGYPGRKLIFD